MKKEVIVEAKDVSFSYKNELIIDDINFTINKGEFIGIIGPNGSGKTTLLKLMLGLLKCRVGSIKLFGQEISEFKDWWKIGYVPQKLAIADSSFPATVEEVVSMGRFARTGLFRRFKSKDYSAIKNVLDFFELTQFKNKRLSELSGGQQQKVFIARAMASDPSLLLLDEPTTGVDAIAEKIFYETLSKLNKKHKVTLVLVSHDIGMVTSYVSRVICINRKIMTCPAHLHDVNQLRDIYGEGFKMVKHEHKGKHSHSENHAEFHND